MVFVMTSSYTYERVVIYVNNEIWDCRDKNPNTISSEIAIW
jgi:hypothetical protein